jgi:hypothetical protein
LHFDRAYAESFVEMQGSTPLSALASCLRLGENGS